MMALLLFTLFLSVFAKDLPDQRRIVKGAALLSKAVYERVLDVPGFDILEHENIDSLGIHYYLARPRDYPDEVWLAFPGSNFSDVKQLATNLNVQTTKSGLHKGFAAVRPGMIPLDRIKELKPKRTILVGHSKGGGHAHALHVQLRRKHDWTEWMSVGLGTPYWIDKGEKLGDAVEKFIQVVIPTDPVPKLLDSENPLKGLVALFAGLMGGGNLEPGAKMDYEPAGVHWFIEGGKVDVVSTKDGVEEVRKRLKVGETGQLDHHGVRHYVRVVHRVLRDEL